MTGRGSRPVVGLNLTWLVPGVVGGSEEYTIRLLNGVGGIAEPYIRFRVYARRDLFERYPTLGERFTPVVLPRNRFSKAGRVALEQTWLGRVSAADDAVHHMGGTMPFVRGRRAGQRTAVTVHDLQPIDLAGNFPVVKRTWLDHMIPLAVKRADLIVCPSRFTAKRIADRYEVGPGKLRVVRQGYRIDPESRAGRPSAEIPARLSGRRFLLYPAIAYRHKRHQDLVEALSRLPGGLADVDLVFSGRAGPETEQLRSQVNRAGLSRRVHFVGRVPESDLNWLYANATALVFASEYEGFGNPCLEAMARGCPVLAADATALREVVENAGVLVPPRNIAAWVGAIVEVADDPRRAAELAALGRRRAAAFDPDIASERLLAVYCDLLGISSVADSFTKPDLTEPTGSPTPPP